MVAIPSLHHLAEFETSFDSHEGNVNIISMDKNRIPKKLIFIIQRKTNNDKFLLQSFLNLCWSKGGPRKLSTQKYWKNWIGLGRSCRLGRSGILGISGRLGRLGK